MATRRKQLPLVGGVDDTVTYRAAAVLIASGKMTRLLETTVPAGTRDIPVRVFVPDPKGTEEQDGVRGRFETQLVTHEVRKLTQLEYDDPNG